MAAGTGKGGTPPVLGLGGMACALESAAMAFLRPSQVVGPPVSPVVYAPPRGPPSKVIGVEVIAVPSAPALCVALLVHEGRDGPAAAKPFIVGYPAPGLGPSEGAQALTPPCGGPVGKRGNAVNKL